MSRRRVDRGETTAEVVLAVPTVFMVVLVAIQLAMYAHASTVATVSAAAGAAAAAAVDGSPATGISVATRTVVELSGRLAAAPEVEWRDSEVAVTVRLDVPRVAPFVDVAVTRTAREPRERFIPEDER